MDFDGQTYSDTLTVLSEQTTSVTFSGVSTPPSKITSTLEFVRGIGLISSAAAGEGISSSSTLVSYTIP